MTLYKVIMNLVYAVASPYLAYRRRSSDEWRERCGFYSHGRHSPSATDSAAGEGVCHFHASSVGEVRVLERLIKAMKTRRPHLRYNISTYTRAGQALARDLFADADSIFYFPLDCRLPLRRYFARLRPSCVVIVETEIWPYFLSLCRNADVPVMLANGRMSERTAKWYRFFRPGLAPLYTVYKKFLMQTRADVDRIVAAGVAPEKVTAVGNIKHDPQNGINGEERRNEVRESLGLRDETLFFIAASTRPGEEKALCDALRLVSSFPDRMVVLIAPRHLERLGEVRTILNTFGYDFCQFSDVVQGKALRAPIIVMDEMGLLTGLFYGADLAFVGGTLADLGGHNIMEPVLAGAPVLFGPSVFNVSDAADRILREKRGMLIHDADELAAAMNQFAGGTLRFRMKDADSPLVADLTADVIIRELNL